MATAKVFLATVQLLIHDDTVQTPSEAADWVSGVLGNLGDTPEGLLDWAYLRLGAQRLVPQEQVIDVATYTEGAAFA